MGVTDSKAISLHIDKDFRSIRKYYDNFYGEITLVHNKSSQKLLALVEKVMFRPDNSFS